MKTKKIVAVVAYFAIDIVFGPPTRHYVLELGASPMIGWAALVVVCLTSLLVVNAVFHLNVLSVIEDIFGVHRRAKRSGPGASL